MHASTHFANGQPLNFWGFDIYIVGKNTMVVPNNYWFNTKNDHFGVHRGYHHLRKHPYSRKIILNVYFMVLWLGDDSRRSDYDSKWWTDEPDTMAAGELEGSKLDGFGFMVLPWKLTCFLKINGWKMYSLLRYSLFRGHVSFRRVDWWKPPQ